MSWEPWGQPFPSRWPQGCKKQAWQNNKYDELLIVVFASSLLSSKKVVKVGPPLTKLSGSAHVLHLCRVVMSVSWSDLLALMVFVLLFHMCLDPHQNLKRLLPLNMFKPISIFYLSKVVLLFWILFYYSWFTFVFIIILSCLSLAALWSPARKGLPHRSLMCDDSLCVSPLSHMVSRVRCGTWLYLFLCYFYKREGKDRRLGSVKIAVWGFL